MGLNGEHVQFKASPRRTLARITTKVTGEIMSLERAAIGKALYRAERGQNNTVGLLSALFSHGFAFQASSSLPCKGVDRLDAGIQSGI